MEKPIPSLMLVLGIKCLLNWMVVLYQRRHAGRSFLGTFCVSLALADTLLALALFTIYGLEDFRVLGLRFTQYHICLLAQVAGYTYSLLHWPVFLFTGLDHYWTLRFCLCSLHWASRLGYALVACAVWTLALLYIFLASDFYPNLEGDLHWCLMSSSPQNTQVSSMLLLVLGCALIYCCPELSATGVTGRGISQAGPSASQKGGPLSRYALCLTVKHFLSTWAPFVIFQVVLLLFRVEFPSYLDMNVPWLCFLNSFLIGMISWSHSQATKSGKKPALADGFCDWHIGFVYPAISETTEDPNALKADQFRLLL